MKLVQASVLLRVLLFAMLCDCSAQDIQPLPSSGKGQPRAVILTGFEYVVPQLIIGGEWTSTIRITNRGTNPIPTTQVYFLDNLGRSMKATFQLTNGSVVTDVGFTFSMPVGALLEGVFIGGSTAQFGQAIVACSANGCPSGLYGEVTLRNRNASRPDFESVFPFETPAAFQYMLFDGRNGFTTTLYLDSESTSPTTVSIDVVDTANRLLRTVNIPFGAAQAQILTLHVLAPETIGVQGTLVIRSPSANVFITATGLRINPSNSFTPLRAFIPTH